MKRDLYIQYSAHCTYSTVLFTNEVNDSHPFTSIRTLSRGILSHLKALLSYGGRLRCTTRLEGTQAPFILFFERTRRLIIRVHLI
jgi:hypothetical protein